MSEYENGNIFCYPYPMKTKLVRRQNALTTHIRKTTESPIDDCNIFVALLLYLTNGIKHINRIY